MGKSYRHSNDLFSMNLIARRVWNMNAFWCDSDRNQTSSCDTSKYSHDITRHSVNLCRMQFSLPIPWFCLCLDIDIEMLYCYVLWWSKCAWSQSHIYIYMFFFFRFMGYVVHCDCVTVRILCVKKYTRWSLTYCIISIRPSAVKFFRSFFHTKCPFYLNRTPDVCTNFCVFSLARIYHIAFVRHTRNTNVERSAFKMRQQRNEWPLAYSISDLLIPTHHGTASRGWN